MAFRNLNFSPFCAIFSNNGGKLNFQNAISFEWIGIFKKKITFDILRILQNGELHIVENFQVN